MINTSIILSVFNRVDFLKNCLLSLNCQSMLPHEVVISDDGSEMDIVAQLKDTVGDLHFKIKYVRQENKGFRLAKCRNNGVRYAEGDYLIFLDQDLIFTKNFIKTFVEHQRKNQFCVSYPIRLTEKQTELISPSVIKDFAFYQFLEQEQIEKIKKQFRKDNLYYFLKRLKLRSMGPKLRGGAAAINRQDFIKVNGYDENYQGWGNEDDDLGKRLYRAGVIGKNPFYNDFPLHLYHEPHHQDGERVNKSYYQERIRAIREGHYRCEHGYDSPQDEEPIEQMELN